MLVQTFLRRKKIDKKGAKYKITKTIHKMPIFNFFFTTEKFCAFDYGDENQDIYGQDTPPEYDLSKVTVPTALYWGDNDWLAAQEVIHV